MEIIDLIPRASPECDHGTVACRGHLLIEWRANPEREFASAAVLVGAPASRDAIPIRIAGDAAL
jgi:hypothetical protein